MRRRLGRKADMLTGALGLGNCRRLHKRRDAERSNVELDANCARLEQLAIVDVALRVCKRGRFPIVAKTPVVELLSSEIRFGTRRRPKKAVLIVECASVRNVEAERHDILRQVADWHAQIFGRCEIHLQRGYASKRAYCAPRQTGSTP